ncbi:MAG: glycosyltransferase family 2 protein [Bacteroidia bacterium]|nr:glycosyltransferase family 2 protein [Bacteroidia bacterium]
MQFLPLSVVIITHNEEANITRCIQSVQPLTDDIIVIDGGSTDNTVALAQSLGAKVYSNAWQGYSKQKNFGNSKTAFNYVFSIDADEAFSLELCEELTVLFKQNILKTIYRVNLINHYCNKPIKHGAWYPDWHYRLFDKTKISWTESDDVHEGLNWNEQTAKADLSAHLLHYTTQSDAYYLQKMDNYAHLFASKMQPKGKMGSSLKALSSATFRFIKEYILQLGCLDGAEGLKIASAHYIYTRNKYLYLKELNNKKRK